MGFIKSVSPVFDFNKIDLRNINPEIKQSVKREVNSIDQNTYNKIIKKNLEIQLECDFCKGPVPGKTHVLKFADIERFFCCFNCRTSYKEKYSGRIEAIKKRFKKDDE